MSQLRSIMERIIRLLDEIDTIKADAREIYAEAKGVGYDKTALGQAIREIRNREKAEKPDAIERQAIVSLYLAEFDSVPHASARAVASVVPFSEVQ